MKLAVMAMKEYSKLPKAIDIRRSDEVEKIYKEFMMNT